MYLDKNDPQSVISGGELVELDVVVEYLNEPIFGTSGLKTD